jgi:hypothetical protein
VYPILLRQSSLVVSLLVLILYRVTTFTRFRRRQRLVRQLLSTPMLSLPSTLLLQVAGVVVDLEEVVVVEVVI